MLTAQVLSRRIAKWRDRSGLSLDEVGLLAELPPGMLAEIESGTRPLSAAKFERVARALGADPSWLLTDEPARDVARSVARFRSVNGTSVELAAADRRLLGVAAEVGRVGYWLAGELGERPCALHPTPTAFSGDGKDWLQGYQLGERARGELMNDRQPIKSVQGLFEGLGVHVAFVSFKTGDLEAAAVWEPQAIPVVLLNRNLERISRVHSRRAVLAHELCHLLHDASAETGMLTSVTRSSQESDPGEQRANGFSPGFLAPRPWIEGSNDPDALMTLLINTWGFSVEGAAWHTRNTLRVTESDAAALMLRHRPTPLARLSESVAHRQDGLLASVSPLVDGLVGERVARAKDQDILSAGRATELLQLQ